MELGGTNWYWHGLLLVGSAEAAFDSLYADAVQRRTDCPVSGTRFGVAAQSLHFNLELCVSFGEGFESIAAVASIEDYVEPATAFLDSALCAHCRLRMVKLVRR